MQEIGITILDKRWETKISDVEDFTQKIVSTCIDLEKYEISVVFADDPFIHNLNKKYRNKDKPTNTLSFNYSNNLIPGLLIGEIILSFDTISREVEEFVHDFKYYTAWMIIHSALHILGYTHNNDKDESEMKKKEKKILDKLTDVRIDNS